MPFGDGTGPLGQGSMTGRGLGYCSGSNRPGYASGPRLGRRAWRNWRMPRRYYPQAVPTPTEEKSIIKEEVETLQEEIKSLQDRLKELNKKK